MKLVGGVIGQSISTTRIPTIGVGNWGKTWKNHLLVHNRSGHYGGVGLTLICLYILRSPASFINLNESSNHPFLFVKFLKLS